MELRKAQRGNTPKNPKNNHAIPPILITISNNLAHLHKNVVALAESPLIPPHRKVYKLQIQKSINTLQMLIYLVGITLIGCDKEDVLKYVNEPEYRMHSSTGVDA